MYIFNKFAERMKFVNALASREGVLRDMDRATFLRAVFRTAYLRKLTMGRSLKPVAGELNDGCREYLFEGRVVSWPEGGNIVPLAHSYWEVYYDSHEHMFDCCGTEVQSGDVVFDCGACEGFFSMKALEMGAEKVHCFEPSRLMTGCLSHTFRREIQAGRVELAGYLLGGTENRLNFKDDLSDPATGRLLGPGENEPGAYPVRQTTIDGYCEEHGIDRVDYIKADIEGAETEMIQGALGTISRNMPRLSIAVYHHPSNASNVRALIASSVPGYMFRFKGLALSGGTVVPKIIHCIPPGR